MVCAISASAVSARADIPCQYELTIIQAPACGKFSSATRARGLNESGTVVGFYTECFFGPDYGYIWTPSAGMADLFIPPGFNQSDAVDINDNQYTLGNVHLDLYNNHAIVWKPTGQWYTIPPLQPGGATVGTAINNQNNVVGYRTHGSFIKAFWGQNGVYVTIAPTFGEHSYALDVNDNNQVVGRLDGPGPLNDHPFLWNGGSAIDLGLFEGSVSTVAYAINNDGLIVGAATLVKPGGSPPSFNRAVAWIDNQWIELLPDSDESVANDVNDEGYVVGTATFPPGNYIWHDGVAVRLATRILNPPDGFLLGEPAAINNAGQIAGTGYVVGESGVGYLLTPLPPLIGDTDCSGLVDVNDLLAVLIAWGPCASAECPPDINEDQAVNVVDLAEVIANWGSSR
jgi:uncharacterized membrane protein